MTIFANAYFMLIGTYVTKMINNTHHIIDDYKMGHEMTETAFQQFCYPPFFLYIWTWTQVKLLMKAFAVTFCTPYILFLNHFYSQQQVVLEKDVYTLHRLKFYDMIDLHVLKSETNTISLPTKQQYLDLVERLKK